jgi:hypothetical protein
MDTAARPETKLMIVDDIWSVIGSANMDSRGRKLNEEVVFGIRGANVAGDQRRGEGDGARIGKHAAGGSGAGKPYHAALVQQY